MYGSLFSNTSSLPQSVTHWEPSCDDPRHPRRLVRGSKSSFAARVALAAPVVVHSTGGDSTTGQSSFKNPRGGTHCGNRVLADIEVFHGSVVPGIGSTQCVDAPVVARRNHPAVKQVVCLKTGQNKGSVNH